MMMVCGSFDFGNFVILVVRTRSSHETRRRITKLGAGYNTKRTQRSLLNYNGKTIGACAKGSYLVDSAITAQEKGHTHACYVQGESCGWLHAKV